MNAPEPLPMWLVILRPPRETFPADATPDEMGIVKAHFAHLAELCEEGVVFLAGRTREEANPIGLVLLCARDRAEAQRLMDEDPVIESGLFSMELRPYEIALTGKRLSD